MKAKKSFLWALLTLVALLSGCAGSMKMLPDGTYVSMTPVGDTLDRSASVIGRYKVVSKKPDGSPVFEEVSKADLAVGPTVGGQVITGVSGGVATAVTQGVFGIQIARENGKACRDGKCGGAGTVIYNNGKAEALSISESAAKAAVNVSGGTCTTGSCLAR